MTLAETLTEEHHEIDHGFEEFVAGLDADKVDRLSVQRALDTLRRHIYLEEEWLFPPLRSAGLMMPVIVMLREHGELWDVMDRIEGLLGSIEGDAAARAEVVTQCKDILERLDRHNTKEEPIIYPQADVQLPPETVDQLTEFLDDGRMPDGWVCEKATAR